MHDPNEYDRDWCGARRCKQSSTIILAGIGMCDAHQDQVWQALRALRLPFRDCVARLCGSRVRAHITEELEKL